VALWKWVSSATETPKAYRLALPFYFHLFSFFFSVQPGARTPNWEHHTTDFFFSVDNGPPAHLEECRDGQPNDL
jgi:hypothetical protein